MKKTIIVGMLILPISISFSAYSVKFNLDTSSLKVGNVISNNPPSSITSFNDYLNALMQNATHSADHSSTCGAYVGNVNPFIPSSSGIIETVSSCANLEGYDLSGLQIKDAASEWMNLNLSTLVGTLFSSVYLDYTSFEGADATNAEFINVAMNNTNFSNATLAGSEFFYISSEGTNFQNSDLTNVLFKGLSLNGANFSGANLSGSVALSGLAQDGITNVSNNFTNTNFDNANMTGFSFGQYSNINSSFNGTNMNGVNFNSNGNISGSVFRNADMRNTNFGDNTGMLNTVFDGVDLRGAQFSDSIGINVATFNNVIYDETTRWPSWFTPPPSAPIP